MLHVYPPSCELKSQKVKMYVTSIKVWLQWSGAFVNVYALER